MAFHRSLLKQNEGCAYFLRNIYPKALALTFLCILLGTTPPLEALAQRTKKAALPSPKTDFPEDMQALLDSYGGRVTLPLVLQASSKAARLRQVLSQAALVALPPLQSRRFLDTELSWEAGRTFHTEPGSPLDKRLEDFNLYSMRLTQPLSTGTHLSMGLEYNTGQEQTGLTIGVSQSLLRDAFGQSTRLGLLAGKQGRSAQQLRLQAEIEDWAMATTQGFYQTWLLQKRTKAAHLDLQRRERLLRVTQRRFRRGTSERPDLLQVESAHLTSVNRYQDRHHELRIQWRQLLLDLELPIVWATVDPLLIPIDLDTPPKTTCSGDPPLSARLQSVTEGHQVAQWRWEQAQIQLRPDLRLEGQYSSTRQPRNQRDWVSSSMGGGAFDRWYIGFRFSYPFGNIEGRMRALEAFGEKERQSALLQLAKNENQSKWYTLCADWKKQTKQLKNFQLMSEKQDLRVRLEERRYQLGRGTLQQVIQAGDEATAASIQHQMAEVHFRQTLWQILRMNGTVWSTLQKLLKNIDGISLSTKEEAL